MGRKNALLRLEKTLLARREEQHKKLAEELDNLREFRASDSAGDSCDLAFEAGNDEVSSRLAELDDRQLIQLERVLARLQQGTYGICESCQKRIPLIRLNALPYTSFCIHCEREMEKRLDGDESPGSNSWGQVVDAQARMQDQKFNLSEMEMNMSGDRRG
jgi:DnaK suppressor protein